jgi:RNA polymerase sigma-70 factor (ECF subfamily)
MDSTPASLLERLRRPAEAESWSRFVKLYTPLIYFWACRAGLREPDAADLVQDVFAVLVRKMPEFTYEPGKSFRAWLRTVTLNKYRERRRRRTVPTAGDDVALVEAAVPDDAEAFWEAEYRRDLVGRALQLMQAEFQPSTWKACWAQVVEQKPAALVASELGLTVGAVRAAKFRVLCRLRQELAGLLE